MAKRKSLGWTELRVGLLVIGSFLLLAMAIFFIGGESGIFTKKMTIVGQFPSANGLRAGAEVWLEGVMIGNVSSVRVAKAPENPNHRVDVEMRIEESYSNIIRTDSMIGIGTIGLLGDKNVEITRGTEGGTTVGDGGILRGAEVGDIRRIIQGTDDLVANFNLLGERMVNISESIDRGEGTLGKLLTRSEIHDNLNDTVLEARTLVQDIREGSGTTGKLISDDELYQRANAIVMRIEGIAAKIDSGDGTVGRLMNDPAVYDKLDQLISKVDAVVQRIDRGEGTLGKLSRDESLFNDARSAMNRVNTLITAIETGEGTAGKLIKDPTLFNNMNTTVSEIQKLLYDLRQDPKKYLTINLRLF